MSELEKHRAGSYQRTALCCSRTIAFARYKLWLVRFLVLALALSAAVPAHGSQRGLPDPAFDNIPFEQWLKEPLQSKFHWSLKVSRAELSFHQRLASSVEILLDGRDLEKRPREGELLLLIQITDADGVVYRQHGSIELGKMEADVRNVNLQYLQRAFFLPGEYQLAAAILETATNEHGAITSTFHIGSPSQALLIDAWRGIPSVEFLGNDASPESWYLPYIHGRVRWAAAIHAPARLDVILNVSAAPYRPGSRHAPSSGLSVLLPSLKVFAQTGSPSIAEHVVLLDLSRRKTIFDQNDVHDLDWPSLRESLKQANTASIDLHSLETNQNDAQFFVTQVRRVLRSSAEESCVLVILTQPVEFESGEDRTPISTEALPPCHVFYLRFYAALAPPRSFDSPDARGLGRHMGMSGPRMGGPIAAEAFDQLESTLKAVQSQSVRYRDARASYQSPHRNTKNISTVRPIAVS